MLNFTLKLKNAFSFFEVMPQYSTSILYMCFIIYNKSCLIPCEKGYDLCFITCYPVWKNITITIHDLVRKQVNSFWKVYKYDLLWWNCEKKKIILMQSGKILNIKLSHVNKNIHIWRCWIHPSQQKLCTWLGITKVMSNFNTIPLC